jgi:hypothetical protein
MANTPTRRSILNAIAAVAVVPIAGKDKRGAQAAIADFQEADALMRAALERVDVFRTDLKDAEADLVAANRRYDAAARAVCKELRVILHAPV